MFDITTLQNLLIPQIACGDSYLTELLQTKFNFLYLKNKSTSCDDRWTYVRLQLDLIDLAMMSTRKRVDFLKRIEDTKSNRHYNAGGFIDATSKRKAEGYASAFSRARSNQNFARFSESHDKARSDSKAEHHGLTESKARDDSRTEGKSINEAIFQANSSNAGAGKGSSCSTSTSASDSKSTTGFMQPPFSINGGDGNTPKIGCTDIEAYAKDFGLELDFNTSIKTVRGCLPSFARVFFGNFLDDVGDAVNCILTKFLGIECDGGFGDVQRKLSERAGITNVLHFVSVTKNMSGGVQFAGLRTARPVLSPLQGLLAAYSAKALAEDNEDGACPKASLTPSSGRSWQMSYRFGVSFGVTLATFGVNLNLRTQITAGQSYKESELCTTGISSRRSDAVTESQYEETSKQASQGHSNETNRSNNIHNAHRTGMTKRDAYSKHSSCSYSTMDSCGRSHTDSTRRAHSDSTSFGSGESRKEGHSTGEGKAITRTQAILESRMYSQIFDNLKGLLKRVQTEFAEVIELQSATLGYASADRTNFNWCASNAIVDLNPSSYSSVNSGTLFGNGDRAFGY